MMSLLDQISQQVEIYREDWRNGKKGAICDIKCNGVFRFIEMYRGENGMLNYRNPNHENDPIVCVGIAAHWLIHRKSASNILLKLTPKGTTQKFGVGVRQMYENYTEMRFNQFKDMFNDNADTWDWEEDDWEKYFYPYVIQKEKHLNEMSEPLFDYISEFDEQKIRPVMENYIKYLEKCSAKYQRKDKLTGVLNTKLAREIFAQCIENGWMHESESGYEWDGIPQTRGRVAQLAYLCGKIYGFKYNKIGSNSGKEYPEEELDKLFKEKYLEKQLLQVYAADKPQKWRALIDELFE